MRIAGRPPICRNMPPSMTQAQMEAEFSLDKALAENSGNRHPSIKHATPSKQVVAVNDCETLVTPLSCKILHLRIVQLLAGISVTHLRHTSNYFLGIYPRVMANNVHLTW